MATNPFSLFENQDYQYKDKNGAATVENTEIAICVTVDNK